MIRQLMEQNSPLGFALAALVFFCLLFLVIVWKIWRTHPNTHHEGPEYLPLTEEK